jgi:prepilin-type N-terminal cleavage/methylation domain-containing protein
MKSEKGFSLLEVMLAVALIGIIAVGLLLGFGGASRTMSIADERATAESLLRSQMEYIKNQPYINYSVAGHEEYEIQEYEEEDSGYTVELSVIPFNPDTGADYTELSDELFDDDDGIQRITITVRHEVALRGNPIILQGYKVHR